MAAGAAPLIGSVAAGFDPACAASAQSLPCTYTHVSYQAPLCGFPFGDHPPTFPVAITSAGLMVGSYWQCAVPTSNEGFVVSADGTFQTLPRPSGVIGLTCADVNESGMIVGTFTLANGQGQRGFVRTGDRYAVLEPKSSCNVTSASAINADGMIAGNRTGPTCADSLACLWTIGAVIDIPPVWGPRSVATDIDDQGRIVGWMGTAATVDGRAFVWKDGVTELLPLPAGWTASSATAIVDVEGTPIIAGDLFILEGLLWKSSACLWVGEEVIQIPPPPGFDRAIARDVAPGPLVVGTCQQSTTGATIPFVWSAGMMASLLSLIPDGDFLSVGAPLSLNANGQIACAADTLGFEVVATVLSPWKPAADLTGDCLVDGSDLGELLAAWGTALPAADLNGSGAVDAVDLAMLLAQWGE